MGKKEKKKEAFIKKIGDMVLTVESDLREIAKKNGWSEEETVYIFTTSLTKYAKSKQQERRSLAYE